MAGPTISGSIEEGNVKGGIVISSIERSRRDNGLVANEAVRD